MNAVASRNSFDILIFNFQLYFGREFESRVEIISLFNKPSNDNIKGRKLYPFSWLGIAFVGSISSQFPP